MNGETGFPYCLLQDIVTFFLYGFSCPTYRVFLKKVLHKNEEKMQEKMKNARKNEDDLAEK